MTPKRQLREYQRECIAAVQAAWAAGRTRVAAVMATGLGKTEVFTDSTLLDPFLDAGKRVLIIAHTDELISQAAAKAKRNNPGRRVGIVKGQEFNQTHAQIIVSSRQTLAGAKRREQLRNIGLIIIDECHHALRSNTYGTILEHFGAWVDHPFRSLNGAAKCVAAVGQLDQDLMCGRSLSEHGIKVVGFTATLARGDKEKLSTVWEEVVYRKDILFGIRHGYLLDVRGKRIVVPDLDFSRVRQTAGDYRDTDLADELERTFAPEIIARDTKQHAAGRKGIAFWPLVETAEHGARAFNEAGMRSEVIHGKLGKAERRAMLQRLHTGETQWVHGVAVLTEGFDEPTVDVVLIARPTRSAPLYQQCVGRVLRPDLTVPAAEREPALILDVTGAGAKHDLRSLIDLAPERPLEQVDNDERSLLELEEAWELEIEQTSSGSVTFEFESEEYRGETAVVEFDPLGREKLWSQTAGGTWFMSAGGVAYVFLAESVTGDPGTYDVVLCSKPVRGVQPWAKATDYTGLPLDMAIGWGEEVALDVGGAGTKTLTSRKSAWRKEEPTESQKRLAAGMGIDFTDMTKGKLSEVIDTMKASRWIDPLVTAVKAAMEAER